MAKLMLMNHKGQILPDFNYDAAHSTLNHSKVLTPATSPIDRKPGQPLRFAANVNGIGGNHAHLIMGDPAPGSGTERHGPGCGRARD